MADPLDHGRADHPFEAAVGEASADALLVFDAAWRVRRSNDAADALFGYGRDGLRGRHVGALLAVGEEGPPEDGRTTLLGRCRHGGELPLEAGVAAFREGGARYRVMVLRDLRPRRRQQAEIDDQAMRLRELRCLHALADEVRRDPPFAELVAHVGQSLPQAMADPAASRVRVRVRVMVDDHAWVAGDWRDDATRLTEPIRVAGQTRGAIDVCRLDGGAGDAAPFSQAERDTVRAVAVMLGETVERARKARELARYAGELESFSYSVSHDLRAPLRALDGFSQALANRYPEALDERGRDYLQRIRRASRRMSELIDALLRLSRISRKGMAWQPVDLSRLAREVVDSGTIGEETAVDLLRAGASNFVAKRHLERLVPAVGQALIELRLRREQEAAEAALAVSERRHRAFVTASSLFTWRFTAGAGLVAVDDAWLDLVGMTTAQAAGDGWLAAVHPDDRPHCRDAWQAARREIAAFEQEYRLCCADGRERWILECAVPVRDEAGRLLEWIGAGRDVTERHRLEHERRKLSRALDQVADGIIITDARQVIEYVNPAFERLTGYPAAEAVGRTPRLLRSGQTDPAVIERLDAAVAAGEPFQGVIVNRRRDGKPYHADMSVAPVRDHDGVITHFIASQYDITEKLRREDELAWLANHDPVTGLANRVLLADRLAHLLHQAEARGWQVVIAHLDIDGFGLLNESWGYDGGNHVLKVVGERLAALAGDETAVGRIDSDGFVVMSLLDGTEIHPEHWSQRLSEALAPPITYGGETFSVSTAAGCAVGPADADEADALLSCAETAMHRAKPEGPGRIAFYAPGMSEASRRWLAIERDLQVALEQGQFHLVYQPQVDLSSGRVVGAEALLRWTHPGRGLVSPAEFIPMLERTGLIVSVGEWVIRQACAQLVEWRGAAPHGGRSGDFRVAVNLSLKQFQRRDLADVVQDALRATGADPAALELELTETSLAENPEEAARQLDRLRELGVTVAMDDFGTGYSSLSYLKRLPIDVVKIDRAFVEGVTHDPGDAAILRAVVLMAASRGMKTVAEGVETEEQLRFLVAERCHIVQGYYFSQPVEAGAFAAILHADHPFEVDRAGRPRRSAVVMLEDRLARLRAREGLQAEGIRALEADRVDEALSLLALEGDVIMVIVGPRIGGEDAVAFLDRLWQLHPGAVRVLVAPATEVEVMRRAVNEGRVHRLVHRVDGASGFRDELRAALAARDGAVPPLEDRGTRPVGIAGTRGR